MIGNIKGRIKNRIIIEPVNKLNDEDNIKMKTKIRTKLNKLNNFQREGHFKDFHSVVVNNNIFIEREKKKRE